MIPHDEMEPREKRWLVEVEYTVRGTFELGAPSEQLACVCARIYCGSRARVSTRPPQRIEFDHGDLRFSKVISAQECDENGIVYDPPEVRS